MMRGCKGNEGIGVYLKKRPPDEGGACRARHIICHARLIDISRLQRRFNRRYDNITRMDLGVAEARH